MAADQTNSSRAVPPGTTAALAWEALLDLGAGPGSRVERLERAVRDAVHAGRVPVGAALPPSRQLAESLGVSRWVVTEAYGQLVAEGFLEARTGSATRVSAAAGARSTSPRGTSALGERPPSPVGTTVCAGRGGPGGSREERAADGRRGTTTHPAHPGRPDRRRAR